MGPEARNEMYAKPDTRVGNNWNESSPSNHCCVLMQAKLLSIVYPETFDDVDNEN